MTLKRILAILLLAAMCLSMWGCGETATNEASGNSTGTEPTEIPSTAETTEATEPEPESCWEVQHYVDDFGDPVEECYVRAVVDGTFSNTATANSDLKVIIFYSYAEGMGDIFDFRLLEYGELKATYSSYDDIIFKVKDENGTILEDKLYGNAPNGDPGIFGKGICTEIRLIAERGEYDIPAIITIGSSTYRFTIPCAGFKEAEEEYDKTVPE